MGTRRLGWLATGGVVFLGAGVLAWQLLAKQGEQPATTPSASRAAPASGAVPDVPGAELLGSARPKAPEPTRFQFRVVNSRGEALAYAWVRVGAHPTPGAASPPAPLRVQADETGLVKLEVEATRIAWVRVEVEGRDEPVLARAWNEGATRAEAAAELLPVDDVEVFFGVTQGPDGEVRADHRVLYRLSATSGAQSGTCKSDRSDMSGLLVLGPFPRGSELEVRPDEGERADPLDAPADGWQRVPVTGQPVPILLSAQWTLRLRILGVAPDAEVPIGDRWGGPKLRRLAEGIWSPKEEYLRRGGDFVIGPLEDGRVGVLRQVRPEREPISVELEPGVPLSGHVVRQGQSLRLAGSVIARGSGWESRTPLEPDGTFAFPGTPRGLTNIWIEAIDGQTSLRWVGVAQRVGADPLAVTLLRGYVLSGRVRMEAVPEHAEWSKVVISGTWGRTNLELPADGQFRAVVPGGRTTLELISRSDGAGWFRELLTFDSLDADHEGLVLPPSKASR